MNGWKCHAFLTTVHKNTLLISRFSRNKGYPKLNLCKYIKNERHSCRHECSQIFCSKKTESDLHSEKNDSSFAILGISENSVTESEFVYAKKENIDVWIFWKI